MCQHGKHNLEFKPFARNGGLTRWSEKITAYSLLFSGQTLQATTGYRNACVLVVVPNIERRESLADTIWSITSGGSISQKFWIATQSDLSNGFMTDSLWLQPGQTVLRSQR